VRLVAAGCAAPSHDLANRLIHSGNQPRSLVFVGCFEFSKTNKSRTKQS
jgi:hypothetical protein